MKDPSKGYRRINDDLYRKYNIRINDKSVLIDEGNINMDIHPIEWKFDFGLDESSDAKSEKEMLVELKTPLRFKSNGKYSTEFSAQDFMQCLFRRVKTLCSLYGDFTDVPFYDSKSIEFEIVDKNIVWKDCEHYSSRQKRAMQLGGVTGSFKMKGKFSTFDLALLDFARIFNAGKNPNFGLGQIDFWNK